MGRLAVLFFTVLGAAAQPQAASQATKPPLYNTVKQKLLEGKQVFSYTQSKFDIAGNCEAASTTTTHGTRCNTARWNSRISRP